MIELKLRLDVNDLMMPGNQNRVAANIYPDELKAYSLQERQALRNLLIPMGTPSDIPPQFYTVSLRPGRYLVEVLLPSKAVISQEIELTAEQAEATLRLRASRSGHEWLAWQTISGNVAPAKSYRPYMDSLKSRLVFSCNARLVMVPAPPAGQPPAFEQPEHASWLHQGFFFAHQPLHHALQDESLTGGVDWLPAGAFPPPCQVTAAVHPYANDDLNDLYIFDKENVNQLYASPLAREGHRFYFFINGQGFPAQYCVVPVPWKQLDYSGDVRTQVLAQRAMASYDDLQGEDQGFRLSVMVEEASLSMLIAYLGAGSMQAAQAILKTSTHLLASKMLNPMAAAAGAYVLLGMPIAEAEREFWHDWVRNLMNFFEWLPDGAIQYGRLLLKRSQDAHSLAEARRCFLEGFRRGLPFFSKGVEFLLDGLNRFANDARQAGVKDGEVELALRVTRELALRINPRQPFTTVLMD
jgi:hypothetical protein